MCTTAARLSTATCRLPAGLLARQQARRPERGNAPALVLADCQPMGRVGPAEIILLIVVGVVVGGAIALVIWSRGRDVHERRTRSS
jgi:hypothetical protein